MAKTVWVCKDDPVLEARFSGLEDPRKQDSCHAWFFRNGRVHNHYVLRSQYILDNFTVKPEKADG